MRSGRQMLGSDSLRAGFALLLAWLVRLVHVTGRWRQVGREALDRELAAGRPVICVCWHGRIMMIARAWPGGRPLYFLVSRHNDGDLIARAVQHLGVKTVRGSTERPDRASDKGGSAALREMLRLLRAGASIGLSPDGPRGPGMQVSKGTLTLARLSGVPIIPVSYATSRRRILQTWDRFHLALPFARGVFVFGEPIRVPRHLDPAGIETCRRAIEEELNEVTRRADQAVGQQTVVPDRPASAGDAAGAGA